MASGVVGASSPNVPVILSDVVVSESEDFRHRRLSFASPVTTDFPRNNVVWCEYYEPLGEGKFPAAIVLHSLSARAAHKERLICMALARRGIAGLLVTLPYHIRRSSRSAGVEKFLSADLEQTLSAFDQAIEDALAAYAWLSSRENIDPKRMGAIGVSVGALLTVRLLARAPELRFGVLILGGGGIRTLLQQSIIAKGIRNELVRKKVDLAEAIKRLARIDPVTYAPQVRDRPILMIDGIYDTVIPPDTARELWSALGNPELIWIPTGHLGALFHKRPLISEGFQFVERAIGERAVAPSKPRMRFKNLMSPKFGVVGLTNGEVRPAYVGELFRFDRRGKVAFDLGVMPVRVLTGVSVNISSLGGFGWGDLSAGIAMRPERATRMYFGMLVHF